LVPTDLGTDQANDLAAYQSIFKLSIILIYQPIHQTTQQSCLLL